MSLFPPRRYDAVRPAPWPLRRSSPGCGYHPIPPYPGHGPRGSGTLVGGASALTAAGQLEAPLTAQQEALDTFRHLGDRRGEARTLGNMGLVRQEQGKWNKAVRLHTLALEAFLEGKDDHALATELRSLALALLQQGRNTEALENLELAAALYHRTGDTEGAGDALDRADRVRRRAGAGSRPVETQS